MSAQTFGDITFGIASDEVGLYVQNVNIDFSSSNKQIKGLQGDDVAGAYYNKTGTFNIDGAFKTTGSPDWEIGTAGGLANVTASSGALFGLATTGEVIVTGGSIKTSTESEKMVTITGDLKPSY